MKKLLIAVLTAAVTATSANAAVTVTSTPGSATYSGPTPTYNFDVGSRPTTTGGAYIQNDMTLDSRPLGSTGDFYSVTPVNGPGTLSLAGFGAISSLSFIWGSVDSFNVLNFLDSAGRAIYSITGAELLGANATGAQELPTTNPLVNFSFSGADQNVAALQFTSTDPSFNSSNYSFEIDNLAISPVPEPATWGMMMLGLGIAGASLRRRRSTKVRFAAA